MFYDRHCKRINFCEDINIQKILLLVIFKYKLFKPVKHLWCVVWLTNRIYENCVSGHVWHIG